MKKISEIDKHKLSIANIVDEVYNRGYERGYSSEHKEEIKEEFGAGFECGIEQLRDALLDRDFLKANYGSAKLRDILMNFSARDIAEEYFAWINTDDDGDDEDEKKPRVCSLVGFICPYDADCKNCDVQKSVERALEIGGNK